MALKKIASVQAVKKAKHFGAEDLGHDFHGKQVVGPCRLPSASAVEYAGGDNRMDVGMKSEVSRPGVQDHGDAEQAAESSLSELEQSLAGKGKERLE